MKKIRITQKDLKREAETINNLYFKDKKYKLIFRKWDKYFLYIVEKDTGLERMLLTLGTAKEIKYFLLGLQAKHIIKKTMESDKE